MPVTVSVILSKLVSSTATALLRHEGQTLASAGPLGTACKRAIGVPKLFAREGLLAEDEYHRHTAALAQANYHFLSFDAGTLMWAIESEQARLSPAVTALFKSLEGPECAEESAIRVVADTIKALWLTPGMLDRKLLVLDLALSALTKGRSVDTVLQQLSHALQARFRLAPLPLPTLLSSMELWQKRLLLTRGWGNHQA
jgi:hypothetical protein